MALLFIHSSLEVLVSSFSNKAFWFYFLVQVTKPLFISEKKKHISSQIHVLAEVKISATMPTTHASTHQIHVQNVGGYSSYQVNKLN